MDGVIFDPAKQGSQDQGQGSGPGQKEIPEVSREAITPEPTVENVDTSTAQPSQSDTTQPEVLQTEPGYEDPNPPDEIPPRGGGLWKKIIIGLIVVVVLVFVTFLFLPKGTSTKNAKLVWWGLWEDQKVMQSLIDDFEKKNPNITVEYVKQDPKQYREKLQTRIKNGTGPDIFRFHNTWVPMLSKELLPLSTDVMSPTEFKKTFYPVMQKDLVRTGAIYGIPIGVDSLALFVNTELLEAAGVTVPQTWEEFVNAAPILTVKTDGKIQTSGAALGTYGNITHAPDIISLLFIQQGIDMKKFPTAPQKKKVDVLNFYTTFAKGNENVWDGTLDESLITFARGNLAMYIGFSWDIFRIKTINKDLSFKTHPVPQLVGRKAGLASYWAEGVSSKSKNQKEALIFMQYLAEKETNQKFYTQASKTREFGEIYPRVDLASSLKDNEILSPFVEQLNTAQSSFFASDTFDGEGGINSLSNSYLGDTVNSIINDNSSPQTVAGTLDKGVSQVFKKYGVK